MSFGKLLYKTNYDIRKIFRKLETTRKKIVKRQWSIIFVKRCLDINVQSKFYSSLQLDNCTEELHRRAKLSPIDQRLTHRANKIWEKFKE